MPFRQRAHAQVMDALGDPCPRAERSATAECVEELSQTLPSAAQTPEEAAQVPSWKFRVKRNLQMGKKNLS